MHVHAEICLIPLGAGLTLSPYIAECQRVLEAAGLQPDLHAYGTNVEGDWDTVMRAIRDCHQAVHAMGAPRIHTSVKLGTRTDRSQALGDKVRQVREALEGSGR